MIVQWCMLIIQFLFKLRIYLFILLFSDPLSNNEVLDPVFVTFSFITNFSYEYLKSSYNNDSNTTDGSGVQKQIRVMIILFEFPRFKTPGKHSFHLCIIIFLFFYFLIKWLVLLIVF